MLVKLTELLAKNHESSEFKESPILLGYPPVLIKQISLSTTVICRVCYLRDELRVYVKETMEEIIEAFEEA